MPLERYFVTARMVHIGNGGDHSPLAARSKRRSLWNCEIDFATETVKKMGVWISTIAEISIPVSVSDGSRIRL